MEEGQQYRISETVRKFNRNQKHFLMSQIVGSIYNTLISGVMITGFLLYMKIPVYWAGILVSIPMLSNVIQVLLDHLWDYVRLSGRMITGMVFIGRMLILSVVFVPFFIHNFSGNPVSLVMFKIVLVAAIWLPAYIISTGAGIRMNFWMVNSFPAEYSSSLLAYRDRIVIGISALLSFGMGYYIDLLEGSANELVGYDIVFIVAGILCFLDYLLLKDVSGQIKNREVRPFFSSLKEIVKDRKYMVFECYIFLLNFSINIANPYFNAYMIDRLDLKYVSIMGLNVLLAAIEMAVSGLWGKIGMEISWERILKAVTTILGIQFLVWSFVTEKSIWIILVIYITSGLIATGLSASQFMLPYRYVNEDNVFVYMSMHTAVVALGGFSGSLSGSQIIRMFSNIEFQVLNLPFSSMQINMIVSGILILISTVYAKKYILKERK